MSRTSGGARDGRGGEGFALATPLPRCRACVRRSAPRGDRATCGSGTGGPRPARSVDIPLPARRDFGTRAMRSSNPGPRQAPPNAPYARHASRCAGHGAERRGHARHRGSGVTSANGGRHPHADPGARRAPGVEVCGDAGRREAPERSWGKGFALATPLPRCRACVRRSAPRGDRATCGSGTGGPRPARSVDIPLPTRGATSAPARCDRQTPGPDRHRRTPRTRVTRAGARATARSAEVMRDTAGAVSRAPMEVGIPMPTRVPAGHPEWRSAVTPGVGRRPSGRGGKGFELATPLPRCRACVRRSAPRGDRATCGSGTGGPRPARSVDIPLPTRGATSAPARCDLQTPGPGRHRRTPRTRVTRAGARATARSAEVMRDTAGAVSRAPTPGPGRHRRTPRRSVARAGARATAERRSHP
jgi:hypothetical protein